MDEAGQVVLTLERFEWEALVLRHLSAQTDRLVAREDFALACRWRTLPCKPWHLPVRLQTTPQPHVPISVSCETG